jgi:site-specific DNA-methyltransferase (cytosine-N4-specific)
MGTEVISKMRSVSWDFADARTQTGPHGIHPYPARFIPQIPRSLIGLFHPQDDSLVLDPFCGSGTTLVEAAAAGLGSIGIDVHPLATLIAKVKTTPVAAPMASVAREVVAAAGERVSARRVEIPPIPRVDHWFAREVQEALAALVVEIGRLSDPGVRDALKVALSSIIVRVSKQESDTRYAAVEKGTRQADVWLAFERAAAGVGNSLSGFAPDLFGTSPAVRVMTRDILAVRPEEVGHNIGLVITSPPYPNAYEYWLYHKYRMYWLGMDPLTVRAAEIVARAHYFKTHHQTAADFERQMGRCFWLLARVMRPGAHACFVVGRSIIHGREIDNEALLERAAAPHGFRKVASAQRRIAVNRKSFNLAHGTINREGILIFVLDAS